MFAYLYPTVLKAEMIIAVNNAAPLNSLSGLIALFTIFCTLIFLIDFKLPLLAFDLGY